MFQNGIIPFGLIPPAGPGKTPQCECVNQKWSATLSSYELEYSELLPRLGTVGTLVYACREGHFANS